MESSCSKLSYAAFSLSDISNSSQNFSFETFTTLRLTDLPDNAMLEEDNIKKTVNIKQIMR